MAINCAVLLPPGSGLARTNRDAGGGQRSWTKIWASSPSENSALPTRAPQASNAQPRATKAVTRTTTVKLACCLLGHGAAGTWRARFTMPGDRSSAGAAPAFCGVRMGLQSPAVRSGARAPNTGHAGTRPKFRSVAAREYGSGADGSRPGPVGRVLLFSSNSGCVAFFPVRTCFGLCIVSSGRNT